MDPGPRMRAIYEFRPVDHLPRREFYIWGEAIERWRGEGLPEDYGERNLFNFDPPGTVGIGLDLGWCEPPFLPAYEEEVVRVEGDTEIVRDAAGRLLRVFRGRRHGFMPEYVGHPVSCERDWEKDVAPRLDPDDERRYEGLPEKCRDAAARREDEGVMLRQGMVGGYMYLRALMGPEDLLFAFYDKPDLIRRMMGRWVALMDTGLARIQHYTVIDELGLGEDICYNHGLLISPEMVREFLLPCYRQVVQNARARQEPHIYFHLDTDGWAVPAVELYREAGVDVISPWEVAAGCDVVEIGRQWPDLVMLGGIDKRVLAEGKDAIDRHVERVLPPMVERGGYIPTCDHGVPDNVSLESYLHYRRRVCELDH